MLVILCLLFGLVILFHGADTWSDLTYGLIDIVGVWLKIAAIIIEILVEALFIRALVQGVFT